MSETRGVYQCDDHAAILARLLEVFTPAQLLQLSEAMGEALERHYGRVEIEINRGRLFIWGGSSHDAGRVKGR